MVFADVRLETCGGQTRAGSAGRRFTATIHPAVDGGGGVTIQAPAKLGVALWHLQQVDSATAAGAAHHAGEAQRLKIAGLAAARRPGGGHILDEPTTGLHLDDVRVLISVLDRLVDAGHTVLVIEHHMDVIKRATG
jgi:ABC-type branched-subunit amino acid transport system ATPase component